MLDINPATLRNWVEREEIDSGARPGVTTEVSDEVKALRREVADPGQVVAPAVDRSDDLADVDGFQVAACACAPAWRPAATTGAWSRTATSPGSASPRRPRSGGWSSALPTGWSPILR
jgi:hypothetical protein